MSHGQSADLDRLLDGPSFAQAVAEGMQALAAPSRLRILARLGIAPAPVGELAADIGMEGSAVSHQLRLMRHLGLVVGRREGRQVIYSLHDEHVAEMLEQAVAHADHVRLGLASHVAPVSAAGAPR